MFKITRLLASSAGSFPSLLGAGPSMFLWHKSVSLLSYQSRHRVFDLIRNETNEGNVDRIMIEMGGLNDTLRQQAVGELLQKVVDGVFSPALIIHEKFNVHLKKYPEMMYDAYFYRITEAVSRLIYFIETKEEKGKKLVVKEINESYALCFEAVKKMRSEEAPFKEIQLYKNFAHYHCVFLKDLVDSRKAKLCLVKGKDFYKGVLAKVMMHLKVVHEKEKKLMADPDQSQEALEVRQSSISHIHEEKFELFEHFSESLLQIVEIEKELYHREKSGEADAKETDETKETSEQTEEGVQRFQYPLEASGLQPIIEKGVLNYNMVGVGLHRSKHYHRLKQSLIELQYEKQVREAEKAISEQEKEQLKKAANNELLQKMEAMFSQSMLHFKDLCVESEEVEMLYELASTLVAIKMHYFQLAEVQEKNLLQEIGEQVQLVVDCIPQDFLRKTVLHAIVQDLKETFKVDISRFVEKLPRSMRVTRKGRRARLFE